MKVIKTLQLKDCKKVQNDCSEIPNDKISRIGYMDLIYYSVSALILYATSLLVIGELEISVYETIHRQSVWHTISLASLSGIRTSAALSILTLIQVLLSNRFCSNKEKRRVYLLSALSFISLALLLILGKTMALLLSSQLILYYTLKNRIGISTYMNVLLALTSIFEAFSLIAWLIYPFFSWGTLNSLLSHFSYIDGEIFYCLNALLGYPLLVVLLLSWILAFLMPYKRRMHQVKVENYKVRISFRMKGEIMIHHSGRVLELAKSALFNSKFAIPVSLFSLLYLTFYSYAPAINPTGKLTNVDSINYAIALDGFERVVEEYSTFTSWYKSHGLRMASILFAFLIKKLSNLSSMDAVKLSFFFASVFLVFSTYISLRLTFKDKSLSILSIYMTTFSTQIVVGLYSGYLANWLACSLLVLMSAMAISGVEQRKLKHLALSFVLSIIGLFTHPWSWFVYLVALTLFFVELFVFANMTRKAKRISLLLALSFLILGIATDYAGQSLLGLLGGIQSDIPLIRSMRLVNLFLFPGNALYTLQIYVGGFLSNYLIFFLSVVGIASLLKYEEKASWFLVTLNFVISMPVFFLSPNIQARLLYLMPLNIYSAFGCAEVLRFVRKKGVNGNLLLALIILLLANYSFRSVANLI